MSDHLLEVVELKTKLVAAEQKAERLEDAVAELRYRLEKATNADEDNQQSHCQARIAELWDSIGGLEEGEGWEARDGSEEEHELLRSAIKVRRRRAIGLLGERTRSRSRPAAGEVNALCDEWTVMMSKRGSDAVGEGRGGNDERRRKCQRSHSSSPASEGRRELGVAGFANQQAVMRSVKDGLAWCADADGDELSTFDFLHNAARDVGGCGEEADLREPFTDRVDSAGKPHLQEEHQHLWELMVISSRALTMRDRPEAATEEGKEIGTSSETSIAPEGCRDADIEETERPVSSGATTFADDFSTVDERGATLKAEMAAAAAAHSAKVTVDRVKSSADEACVDRLEAETATAAAAAAHRAEAAFDPSAADRSWVDRLEVEMAAAAHRAGAAAERADSAADQARADRLEAETAASAAAVAARRVEATINRRDSTDDRARFNRLPAERAAAARRDDVYVDRCDSAADRAWVDRSEAETAAAAHRTEIAAERADSTADGVLDDQFEAKRVIPSPGYFSHEEPVHQLRREGRSAVVVTIMTASSRASRQVRASSDTKRSSPTSFFPPRAHENDSPVGVVASDRPKRANKKGRAGRGAHAEVASAPGRRGTSSSKIIFVKAETVAAVVRRAEAVIGRRDSTADGYRVNRLLAERVTPSHDNEAPLQQLGQTGVSSSSRASSELLVSSENSHLSPTSFVAPFAHEEDDNPVGVVASDYPKRVKKKGRAPRGAPTKVAKAPGRHGTSSIKTTVKTVKAAPLHMSSFEASAQQLRRGGRGAAAIKRSTVSSRGLRRVRVSSDSKPSREASPVPPRACRVAASDRPKRVTKKGRAARGAPLGVAEIRGRREIIHAHGRPCFRSCASTLCSCSQAPPLKSSTGHVCRRTLASSSRR